MSGLVHIKRALISVSDKSGVLEFAQGLVAHGVQLLSTGGTARMLRDAGLEVVEIGDYTGFPEMLDGRVKTLHPKVHGGILARRDSPAHMATLAEHDIPCIDLLCVNLYPFRETVARPGVTLSEAIENIDIGGPAMLRSAAKNYAAVAIVTDPMDYAPLLQEMQAEAALSLGTRFNLAKKAFVHTARYDSAIANWLTALADAAEATPEASPQLSAYPTAWQCAYDRVEVLRYGENPHQSAAFYKESAHSQAANPAYAGVAHFRQLQGKELSYNNLADADAAWECVHSFSGPACVIVKHANPCGVAIASTLHGAYEKAFQTDPTSAFGGILAFNGEVDADVVNAMLARQHFVEVLIAPAFSAAALALLNGKQNLRVLVIPPPLTSSVGPATADAAPLQIKQIGGGLLLQTADSKNVQADALRVVTKKAPTPAQLQDLIFAWRVAKFVKSNAIVFCGDGMTLGVGAGQMSRVDATRIASIKAAGAELSLAASCVASDAFFPFRDGIDVLAAAGAAAVIQPGGSMRDAEVIAAADAHGLVMVFTGYRHFRH